MKKFFKEFKEFAFKGNVIDLAVGVMIGAAFGNITTSLVNDIFMPLLGLLVGKINFSDLYIALDGQAYASLAAAEEAGAACFKYGAFINAIINFLLIAFCIFLFVRFINKLNGLKKKEAAAPAEPPRLCPYCKSEIAKDATRCPHCTSDLTK